MSALNLYHTPGLISQTPRSPAGMHNPSLFSSLPAAPAVFSPHGAPSTSVTFPGYMQYFFLRPSSLTPYPSVGAADCTPIGHTIERSVPLRTRSVPPVSHPPPQKQYSSA